MKNSIDSEKILILDFGSQYTQLIARRVREIGVFSEIVSHQISYKEILKFNPKGIILSGGPESVYTKKTLKKIAQFWKVLFQYLASVMVCN